MSSLLQSLQNLSTQRGLPASQSESGQLSAPGASFGVGSQGFSSLMNQFREGQGQPSPQINVPPPASASGPAALRARTAERGAKPLTPQTPRPNTAQRDAGESRVSAAAAERAKAAAKAHQAKPPSPPTPNKPASPDHPRQDEGTVAQAKVEDRAEDTIQADPASAAAWVRELQPPADVSSTDPASMLAWLSSLAQSDASAGMAEMVEEGSTNESAANRGLPAGADGRASTAPGWAVQAAALSDQGSSAQGQARDQSGAFSLESLGMAPLTQEESLQASPLDFNAMMAREMGRTASPGTPGADSLRHHTGSLSTPVNSPDFQQALADRVGLWVSGPASAGPMTAELSLNPAEMGPVQIRIVLDGQSAHVDFAAAHAETRQAIEASLPALSSALEEAGLSLSGGGVSDQSSRQSWQGQSSEQPQGWMRGGQEAQGREVVLAPAAATGLNARVSSGTGGLDLYA